MEWRSAERVPSGNVAQVKITYIYLPLVLGFSVHRKKTNTLNSHSDSCNCAFK